MLFLFRRLGFGFFVDDVGEVSVEVGLFFAGEGGRFGELANGGSFAAEGGVGGGVAIRRIVEVRCILGADV